MVFKKGNKIGANNRFQKGHNKGIPRSEEIRNKISESLKGGHLSEKTKNKISIAQKGNINRFKKGNTFGFKKGHKVIGGFLKEDKNINYKGGITPVNEKIRKSFEYKDWRKEIFKRDNYTCKKCEQVGKILRAHHIYNFSTNPELRLVISNGLTLCDECHTEFHRIYGKINNNQEQITEYLNE